MKRHHREITVRREIAANFLEERHAKEHREMMNSLSDVKKQKYSKEGATRQKKQDDDVGDKKKTKGPWWKTKLKEISLKIITQTPEIIGGFAGFIAGQYDEYSQKIGNFLNMAPTPITVGPNRNIREMIAQKESKGNYNIMNIVGSASDALIIKGEKDVTTGKTFENNLTDMTMGEVYDLGKRRNAYYKGKGGEAAGKYQFVPSTLAWYAGMIFGKDWRNQKFSIENQERVMDQFEETRAVELARQGVPLTKESAYLYHLKPSTVGKILKADPDVLMGQFLSEKERTENERIANQTVGQYRKKLQAQGFTSDVVTTSTATIPTVDIKSVLDRISIENEELKKAFKESITAIVDESTKIINSITQNQVNVTEETPMSDIPTVLTK
jgi:hypothetical protein